MKAGLLQKYQIVQPLNYLYKDFNLPTELFLESLWKRLVYGGIHRCPNEAPDTPNGQIPERES